VSTTTTTTTPTAVTNTGQIFQHDILHAMTHQPWFVYVVFFGALILSAAAPAKKRRHR
jgi:hypothetical protein